MNSKKGTNPGHITTTTSVNDRVCNTVSPSEQISVSETARNVMTRTRNQAPDNELDLRGIKPLTRTICPEVIEELKRTEGAYVVDAAIRAGLIPVA